jgi:hypothetical protein
VRLTGLVFGCALALIPSIAFGAAEPDRRAAVGTVVAIDSGELVVDMGADRGVTEGQLVELWRPLRIKHPVTGKMLTDHFRLGMVRLTQVQKTLSLAKVDGTLLRPPATGDEVRVPTPNEPAPPITPWNPLDAEATKVSPPAGTPPPAAAPIDPDAVAVTELFDVLRGVAPEARVTAYERFAKLRPRNRFANLLHDEAVALRSRGATEDDSRPALDAPILRLRPGTPQRYAVELDPRFVAAVVHVRPKDGAGYRSIPMTSVGPRYWSAALPGDAVTAPAMEYFVEGVPKSGAPVAVVGSATAPKEAPVDPSPFTGKKPGTLARAAVTSEYASFNTKKANDYLVQTEGTFGWRLGNVGIRAVRSGFGVLRGKGGTLADLDTLGGKGPHDVGLTYGYVEGEIAPSSDFALIGRPIVGLRDGGVAGGAQGFVRIGNDLKTNLLVGGELLGTVGLRGIVELDWRTIPRVPIALRSEVTNQPAGFGADVGARAILQAGYELTPELTLSARGSYQGRTINHAGPGAGLGVSYQW